MTHEAKAQAIADQFYDDDTLSQSWLKTAIATALAKARREVWEEAASIAGQHECGGEDDITCQHRNCAWIIETQIRAKAREVGG